MKGKSIWIKIIASAFIIYAVILVTFFVNFSILTSVIIGDERAYYDKDFKTSKFFDVFYTISSDTGYNPEPSYFNFILTILTGIFIGGIISYKLFWRLK